MKKTLTVVLTVIAVIACIAGLCACNGDTRLGTYYGGYKNDASAGKITVSSKYVTSGNNKYTYSYENDVITLSTGVNICFAEKNQVAYYPVLRGSFNGSINTRNGYFFASLSVISNGSLTNTYQFYQDGTFRFVNVTSAKIINGTYYLKDGVLSLYNQSDTGSSGYLKLDKLHFWYIDDKYNVYFGALIKDYTLFQKTDDETSGKDDTDNSVDESHTLTYNFNYEGANTITQQVTKDEKINLISPTRDGYKFLGWYCSGEKVDSGEWKFAEDVTLDAHWEAITYSITYNINGGTLPQNALASFTVEDYALPYALPVPTKPNFNFAGWYETADFSDEPVTAVPKDNLQNYVLYAKYTTEQFLEFELSFDETYYSVVGYSGAPQYVTVPQTHNGLPVKEIAAKAFANCNTLVNIILSDGICKIGDSAFLNCYNSLVGITLPDSVTYIGDHAFDGCGHLESIAIPDSVTFIGDSAFRYCEITNMVIPNGITTIYDSTFASCWRLSNITIPNSVTSIGYEAFYGCSNLTSIIIPNGVTSIGYRVFSSCHGLTNITIPNGVTTIGEEAFYECSSLIDVILPDSVTYVGSNAFPSSLYKRYGGCYYLPTQSSEYGFLDGAVARDITNVKIHDDCAVINNGAFGGCNNLVGVTVPGGVTSIGSNAFYDCNNLTSVNYTGTITNWCNIDFGNYEANPLYYAHNLYVNNKLVTELIIPDTITEIKPNTFQNCTSITSVTIPNGITVIGGSAFGGCRNLETVYWNATACASAGSYSSPIFSLTKLTTIVIGGNVKRIPADAFYNCSDLEAVYYDGTLADWCNICFDNSYANPMYYANKLYINNELVSGEVIIDDNVTEIRNYAFMNCAITSIVIPDSIESIGEYAFNNCRMQNVYYKGTAEDWNKIIIGSYNGNLSYASRRYYRETEPTEGDYWYDYWHYDTDGKTPVVWKKDS